MALKLKLSDRKIHNTEKDPLELALELDDGNDFMVKEKEVEPEFNPWDYIRVVNVRGEPEYQAKSDEKVIIAYRDNPILGNQHVVENRSMKERDRVIEAFGEDLEADLAIQGPMWKALQEIAYDIVENKQKIALACWCMPCPCHALKLVPVIVEMVNDILNNKNLNKKKLVKSIKMI
jgi:hypothetical protein